MEEHSIGEERDIKSGIKLNNRYEIIRTIGEGGFGITYEAHDNESGRNVCIKEYFPSEYAVREHADSNWSLHVFSGKKEGLFIKGKQRFLKESNILKEFQYMDGIVTVMDSFQENNTAYIVMEYIEGITLKKYIEENGRLTFDEVIELIKPVMTALVRLHKQGFIHRDISPDNLMIGLDNKLRLIDFGAAELADITDERTRTVILKAGFAPPEQYISDGKQGPWTDVYAMAATIYTAITGHVPVASIGRLQGKELVPPSEYNVELELWQWNVISKGMSINISDRYRDMECFLEALIAPDAIDMAKTEYGTYVGGKLHRQIKGERRNYLPLVAVSLVILLIGVIFIFIYNKISQDNVVSGTEPTTVVESTTEKTEEVTSGAEADSSSINDVEATERVEAEATTEYQVTTESSDKLLGTAESKDSTTKEEKVEKTTEKSKSFVEEYDDLDDDEYEDIVFD